MTSYKGKPVSIQKSGRRVQRVIAKPDPKKVIWNLKQDAGMPIVNHKGDRCIHLDGPPICQEGDCSGCEVHKRHQRNV